MAPQEAEARSKRRTSQQIIGGNGHRLGGRPDDAELRDFVDACFQDVIDDRGLQPCWVCVACGRLGPGATPEPDDCDCCSDPKPYAVGNFQARASVCGTMFQEVAKHILDTYYPDPGLVTATEVPDRDHCDIHVPSVVGVELKGSPSHVHLPGDKIVKLGRAGIDLSKLKGFVAWDMVGRHYRCKIKVAHKRSPKKAVDY
jgi:hypothetical protein